MRIAITGHRNLDETTTDMVENEIRTVLSRIKKSCDTSEIIGISCLAAGADQIFARVVLDMGGRLEVIIPAIDYATTLGGKESRHFEELKDRAIRIQEPTHQTSCPRAYLDAGRRMLKGVGALMAVWDGEPARGTGGTAEIVYEARRLQIQVHRIWPEGAARVG